MTTPAFVPSRTECVRGIPVMEITGRLDSASSSLFDAQAAPFLAAERSRILFDLSSMTYIRCAGLGPIMRIVRETASSGGRRMGIFAVPAHILELNEFSGFRSLIDIYQDRESALSGSSS
jgi:anti-anti-sigma factor